MIDLILVNEDTGIFGNEVSIQGDVSRGAKEKRSFNKKTVHESTVIIKTAYLPVRNGKRDI